MKPIWTIFVAFLFAGVVSFAQNEHKNTYWVKLTDKKGTKFQLSHPEAFLSQRSIQRRIRQQIPFDETDLPVSADYLDSLKKRGLEIVHTSKWLNGATVKTADTALIRKIAAIPFVALVQLTKPAVILKSAVSKFREVERNADIDPATYGNSINQLLQVNGQYLHNRGFRGKGIQVAVLDAGFWHVSEISAFDSLRNNNRILGTRDFVDPKSDFFQQHTHGMSVLSCMAGNLPGQLIGTSPDASFFLFRSEDAVTEYPVEEDNWVAAAELADSLGVDVINSSLGYNIFDDPQMSHEYSDMNGKKTRVTQGANMAFQKGILVFSSAGNEGSDPWKYIIAPADGENVIAVAAVDKNGVRASFSSVGPAFGGAVKPNVAALGSLAYLVTGSGVPGYASGTSFASPVLAGMGACLLQANPDASVKQVKMAIEQSASRYNNPDSLLGYGIPDFKIADQYLKVNNSRFLNRESSLTVLPNPFTDYIFIHNPDSGSGDYGQVYIYNIQGVCLWQSTVRVSETIILKNLANLPDGFLILSLRSGAKEERIKLIKVSR